MAPPTRPATSTMLTAVENILESFIHAVLTPIVGIPTYNALVDRIYQISSSATLMQTTLGGGKLGFLVLIVLPTVYATLSTTSLTKSANPGPVPLIPKNSTGIKQTSIWYKFILDTELYSLLQNMDKSLKQQLLGGVEDIYVR